MTRPAAVRLPAAVRRGIVAHACRDAPLECCGLLVGRERTVWFAIPMANVLKSAVRYRVDDRAHIACRRMLRGTMPALSILGSYHSHPRGAAEPSPADHAQAFYPEWLYVIVGLGGSTARIRGFSLDDGRLVPERLR